MANDQKEKSCKKIKPTKEYLRAVRYVKEFMGLNLEIDPFAGPEFAFHKIFLSKPPTRTKGIDYPKNFRYWREISREQLPEVEGKIEEHLQSGDMEPDFDILIDCLTPIFDIDLPPKQVNRLLTIVKRLLKLQPDREDSRGICIIPEETDPEYDAYATCPSLPKAFLPPVSWFNEKLQGLTVEDILTILPAHEQNIYVLTIGRALVGPSGTVHEMTEYQVDHTWRTAPILTGMPGIGKSTITLTLADAIRTTGYKVSVFNNLSKQFGVADIITADLAYADDLVDETFKNYIKSPIVKQCITGGSIRTEKKFLDEVETKPRAAFLSNINDFNIGVTYGTDDGVLDRLKVLDCQMPTQFDEIKQNLTTISKDSPDLHPVPHLKWLCKQFDCSMDALMLRFARICADRFMEEVKNDTLNQTINASTTKLKIQLHKHYEKVIAMVFQLSYILRRDEKYNAGLPDLKPSLLGRCIKCVNYVVNDDRAHNVREAIKRDWKAKDKPSYHPWTGIKLFDQISVANAEKAYTSTSASFADQELDKSVKTIFGCIRLNQGYNVPANTAQVIRAWDGSKKQFNSLLTLAEYVRKEISSDELANLTSGDIAKTQHIRGENYDRQAWADERNNGGDPMSTFTANRKQNRSGSTRRQNN